MACRKYTEQERREVLALGVKAAAREHGVPPTTVQSWIDRGKANGTAATTTRTPRETAAGTTVAGTTVASEQTPTKGADTAVGAWDRPAAAEPRAGFPRLRRSSGPVRSRDSERILRGVHLGGGTVFDLNLIDMGIGDRPFQRLPSCCRAPRVPTRGDGRPAIRDAKPDQPS